MSEVTTEQITRSANPDEHKRAIDLARRINAVCAGNNRQDVVAALTIIFAIDIERYYDHGGRAEVKRYAHSHGNAILETALSMAAHRIGNRTTEPTQ